MGVKNSILNLKKDSTFPMRMSYANASMHDLDFNNAARRVSTEADDPSPPDREER